MAIDGVNGKGNSLELLFGGLNGNASSKQADAAQADAAQQAAAATEASDSAAVKVSVGGEDKSDRVAALKSVYAAGGDQALNSLYKSDDVAKALLG